MPERPFEYQPDPISKHQAKYGENWTEREQFMFSIIAKQVDVVSRFKDVVDSITLEQSEYEAIRKLEIAREQVWDDLFQATTENGYHPDDTEDDRYEFSPLADKKLYEMIDGTTEMLEQKYLNTQSLPALDRDKLGRIMEARTDIPRDIFSRAEVVWGPFSVTFIFAEADYAVVAKRYGYHPRFNDGIHLGNSEFNFIKAKRDKSEQDEAIRHENIHNLLDATKYEIRQSNPASTIHELTSWIKQDYKVNGEEAALDRAREYFGGSRIRDLIDGIHEELLAELENIESGQAWLTEHVDSVMSTHIDSDMDIRNFATVGEYVYTTLRVIREYKNTAPPAFATVFERLENIFTQRVQRIVTDLRSAIYTASRLGPEAFGEIHILAAVLKPTQYHHMKKYLEHKYGKDKVALASSDLFKEA